MAGDWLKFEIATSDKPEVWGIANDLNLDPDAVIGKLLRVWAWFDQQSETGNAPIVTKSLLDRVVSVTGFCDCVIKHGWMVSDGVTLAITNFDRHNGKTSKNRALTAKRVRNFKEKTNAVGNDKVTITALPKEEKRREDKKEKKAASPSTQFSSWLTSLGDNKPIPTDDPIFEYASQAGIPPDYLRLCWLEFKAEFSANDKRQKDWRAHFRNFVRKNYYKLWWHDGTTYALTSRGQQAMNAMRGKNGTV